MSTFDNGPLRQALQSRGWTMTDLAREVGVDYSMVARVMYGERRFGPKNAVIAARALDRPVGALFTLEP